MVHAEQTAQVPPAPAHVSAARPRVFYGWWIVIGAIVAQFIAMGQNQLTNVILGPMTAELGWTRSEFTIAATIGTLLSGALGFVIGAQVDRRGARPLILAGTVISSAALFAIGYVEELWQFWLLRGLVLVLGNVMVGNLVVNVTISKWFVDRRGWAISMAALGVSSWSFVGTQVVGFVVDGYGWRAGWTAMGVATWVLVPVALIMTRQPEDRGLLPDGRHPDDAASDSGRAALARAQADMTNSLTRGEAARTPALWLLILAFGLALTGMTALFAHLIQFFVDVGFTPAEARYFYSLQGLFSLIAKFVWGAAMQRLPAKWLVATSFTIAGTATLGLVYTASSQPWQVVAGFAALWGLATGGMIPLSEFVWASYFGRRHIGAVRGLGLPFTVMLTAGGPLFASEVFDRTGSYNLAMVIFAGLWFAGALLILLARRPQPRTLPTVPLAQRLRTQPEVAPATHAAMASALASTGDTPEDGLTLTPPAAAAANALVASAALDTAAQPVGGAAYDDRAPRHLPRRPVRSYMGEAAPLPAQASSVATGVSVPAPARSAPPPEVAKAAEVARTVEAVEAALPAEAASPALDATAALVSPTVDAVPVEPPLGSASAAPTALEAPAYDWLGDPAPDDPDDNHDSGGAVMRDDADDAEGLHARDALGTDDWDDEDDEDDWDDVDSSAPLATHEAEAGTAPARALAPSPVFPPTRQHHREVQHSPWVPRTTGEAVLAGIVASIVATLAVWFLTRGDDERDSD